MPFQIKRLTIDENLELANGLFFGYVLKFIPGRIVFEISTISTSGIGLNNNLNELFNSLFLFQITLRGRLSSDDKLMAESIALIRLHNPSVA